MRDRCNQNDWKHFVGNVLASIHVRGHGSANVQGRGHFHHFYLEHRLPLGLYYLYDCLYHRLEWNTIYFIFKSITPLGIIIISISLQKLFLSITNFYFFFLTAHFSWFYCLLFIYILTLCFLRYFHSCAVLFSAWNALAIPLQYLYVCI